MYTKGYSKLKAQDIFYFTNRVYLPTQIASIERLIESCELYLCRACKREFLCEVSIIETLLIKNTSSNTFRLQGYPIKKINNIKVNTVTIYNGTGTKIYSYDNLGDIVVTFNQVLQPEDDVSIDYTIKQFWGEDVKTALKQLVLAIMQSLENNGKDVSSESFGSLSQDYTQQTQRELKNIIETYKMINI